MVRIAQRGVVLHSIYTAVGGGHKYYPGRALLEPQMCPPRGFRMLQTCNSQFSESHVDFCLSHQDL